MSALAIAISSVASLQIAEAASKSRSREVHVVDIHSTYLALVKFDRSPAPYSGGPARGRQYLVPRDASCSEPDCPLTFFGGLTQHSPHVYLLLWGPNWTADPSQFATYQYLSAFYSGLGVQPQDNWSAITSQYGDGNTYPSFSGSVYQGASFDVSTPPTGATQQDIAAEADAFASSAGIADSADAQIVVATQSGTCPFQFYAPSTCLGSGSYTDCAWHSYSNEPYISLPYLLDSNSCGANVVQNQYDGFSLLGGHEYAEAITDPYLNAWYDSNSSGEIGDKCQWMNLGVIALSTGSFAMQPLFSNATYASASVGCTMTGVQPPSRITLSATRTNLVWGESTKLTASAVSDIAGTGYTLTILDSGGATMAACQSGISCTVTLTSASPVVVRYHAALVNSEQVGTSNEVTVSWQKARTATRLSLSQAVVHYGHEQREVFRARVVPTTPGDVTGRVLIAFKSKVICAITLRHGFGTCTPSSRALPNGRHTFRGMYRGDEYFKPSISGAVEVKVDPHLRRR